MKLNITVENASSSTGIPDDADVRRWVTAALKPHFPAAELCLRIVDEPESAQLNLHYRSKTGATNVLSFAADIPEAVSSQMDYPLLGDLVICAPVVYQEAREQLKPAQAHWAHMVVHGSLHLAGYDHIDDNEALTMEALEKTALAACGFPDPYLETSPPGADDI